MSYPETVDEVLDVSEDEGEVWSAELTGTRDPKRPESCPLHGHTPSPSWQAHSGSGVCVGCFLQMWPTIRKLCIIIGAGKLALEGWKFKLSHKPSWWGSVGTPGEWE